MASAICGTYTTPYRKTYVQTHNMGLLEFSKLPVNTLVGADWKTFKTLTEGQEIASDKRTKFLLTKAVCRLLSTLSFVQDRRYRKTLADKPLQHDPVFILGHWRSGTTFVHNVLSCDKHFGYCTTYQTVFPHFIMFGQGLFKPTMGWLMPDKRPTDNMELAPDLPQEEEFALQNTCPYTYYNFWIFPKRMMEYARRFLTFETATEEEKSAFRKAFDRMVRIALWNTGGTQFLSKNPPHTGRIKEILKMYPNAKFIYLVRNPYTVFNSTRSFYSNTIKPLELQHITDEEMQQNILDAYNLLYDAYQQEKHLIPEGNLIEVKFEDFEADAMGMTERIYRELSLPGFEEARPAIEQYVGKKRGYKKNKYNYPQELIDLVNAHWGQTIDDFGYERL